jgi:hypothetical protein
LRSTMSPDRLVDLAKLEHYFTIAFIALNLKLPEKLMLTMSSHASH